MADQAGAPWLAVFQGSISKIPWK